MVTIHVVFRHSYRRLLIKKGENMNEHFTPLKPVIVVLNDSDKTSTFLNKVLSISSSNSTI